MLAEASSSILAIKVNMTTDFRYRNDVSAAVLLLNGMEALTYVDVPLAHVLLCSQYHHHRLRLRFSVNVNVHIQMPAVCMIQHSTYETFETLTFDI